MVTSVAIQPGGQDIAVGRHRYRVQHIAELGQEREAITSVRIVRVGHRGAVVGPLQVVREGLAHALVERGLRTGEGAQKARPAR